MSRVIRLLIVSLFLSSCGNDLDMGWQYQKKILARKGDIIVYCYCLSWSSQAYFISFNKDVCLGFDSTKDYCFGRGHQVMYYNYENDTLKIYNYGNVPTNPKNTNLNISLKTIKYDSLQVYEEKCKNRQIEEVLFDSLYDLPCELSNPPINFMNVKFKPR